MRLLKILSLILLLFGVGFKSLLALPDSTKSLHLMFASYNFGFNKVVSSSLSKTAFFYSEFAPLQNPAIGVNLHLPFTPNKNILIEGLYSHARIGYHYTAPNSSINNFNTTGHIRLNGFIINTQVQYKVFDWMKINYGLGHYLNTINTFDIDSVAEEIRWTNNGKSQMKSYTLALGLGVEFKLYKRLFLEVNTLHGVTNFIILNLKSDPTNDFKMKMGFTGISLNYSIW